MTRPIVLPELPEPFMELHGDLSPVVQAAWAQQMHAYARAAVEADRKGIVVTDEDVQAAWDDCKDLLLDDMNFAGTRAALESFAKRLRGETP